LEKKSHFGNIKIVFKVQTQWDPDKSHVKKKKNQSILFILKNKYAQTQQQQKEKKL
jgi:hypothetical protein